MFTHADTITYLVYIRIFGPLVIFMSSSFLFIRSSGFGLMDQLAKQQSEGTLNGFSVQRTKVDNMSV